MSKQLNGQNKTKKNNTEEQKTISLHLNLDCQEKIDQMKKKNFQDLYDWGLKYLPANKQNEQKSVQVQTDQNIQGSNRTPLKSQKQSQSEEMIEINLERKCSQQTDQSMLCFLDVYEKPLSQTLQFLPTSELEEQLNQDINKFIQEIDNYNVKNKHLFDRLISSISKCINETFSEAPVDVYGSFATELCLPQSDIDLVVRIQSNNQNFYFSDLMKALEQKLLKERSIIEETKYIPTATMPVLKVKCTKQYHNKRIDISLQEQKHNGLLSVQLVKDYLQVYEPLRALTLVIKHFLYCSNLSDTYQGGLSSYGLILMIVSFLQSKQLTRLNQPSLATLMMEFLYLYGSEMDYAGKTIYAHLPTQKAEFPPIYFDPQNFVFHQNQTLLIVDPLNKQNNVGRPTYLVQKLKLAFNIGFCLLLTQQSPIQNPLKVFFSCAQNLQLSLQSQAFSMYKPMQEHLNIMRNIPILTQNF